MACFSYPACGGGCVQVEVCGVCVVGFFYREDLVAIGTPDTGIAMPRQIQVPCAADIFGDGSTKDVASDRGRKDPECEGVDPDPAPILGTY